VYFPGCAGAGLFIGVGAGVQQLFKHCGTEKTAFAEKEWLTVFEQSGSNTVARRKYSHRKTQAYAWFKSGKKRDYA